MDIEDDLAACLQLLIASTSVAIVRYMHMDGTMVYAFETVVPTKTGDYPPITAHEPISVSIS